MESTKSNLRENQKKSYQCKQGQQDSQSIDDCASCVFFFVHTSLCYNLFVNIADPSSMQNACHMNFVIDLAHRRVSVAQW